MTHANDLINAIALKRPQEKITATIYRKSKQLRIKVTLGEWPDANIKREQNASVKKSQNSFGIVTQSADYLSESILNNYGLNKKTQGQIVTYVAKDSPAHKALIKVGDVIVMVNMDDNPTESKKK